MKSEGIRVEYCPTEKMIVDFFTKILQVSLFKKFRWIFLGYKHISTLHEGDEDSLSQDRVVKDFSEGNVKRYGEGLSVVGSKQRGMSYAESVSKWKMKNRMMIANNLILLK